MQRACTWRRALLWSAATVMLLNVDNAQIAQEREGAAARAHARTQRVRLVTESAVCAARTRADDIHPGEEELAARARTAYAVR